MVSSLLFVRIDLREICVFYSGDQNFLRRFKVMSFGWIILIILALIAGLGYLGVRLIIGLFKAVHNNLVKPIGTYISDSRDMRHEEKMAKLKNNQTK